MTVQAGTQKIHTLKFTSHVAQYDIDNGICRDANKCMIKVSVERKLRALEDCPHYTRVDAGHIRFTYKGYRWVADMPKRGKACLIEFDLEAPEQRRCRKLGLPFKSKVAPFSISVVAVRKGKLPENTPERRRQISEARRQRKLGGIVDKRYTLHERVTGFA